MAITEVGPLSDAIRAFAEKRREDPRQDTICLCGHWFEEHYVFDQNAPVASRRPCEGCDECSDFTFDPEMNTPESIADRGGEHDTKTCQCALCKKERADAA